VGTKIFYELQIQHEHVHSHASKFLQYEEAWIQENILSVPQDVDPVIYAADQVLKMTADDHELKDANRRMRSLVRNVTEDVKGVMVVARVSTADEDVGNDVETINDYIFGTPETSFKDVHAACSFNNKIVRPYNESEPVLDLFLDENITGVTFGSFYAAVEPLIEEYLGVSNIEEVAEFIMLVSPNGLRPTLQTPNFRFVAAGAYNSWKSVVTDDWVDTPQVIQHIVG
jgi:hypothetical protein